MNKNFYKICVFGIFFATHAQAQTSTTVPSPLVTNPAIPTTTIPKTIFKPSIPQMVRQPITSSLEAGVEKIALKATGRALGGAIVGKVFGIAEALFVPPYNPAGPYDDILRKPGQRKIQYGYIGVPTIDAYRRYQLQNLRLSAGETKTNDRPPFVIQNTNTLTIKRALELGDILLDEDEEFTGYPEKNQKLRQLHRSLFLEPSNPKTPLQNSKIDLELKYNVPVMDAAQRLLFKIFSQTAQKKTTVEQIAIVLHPINFHPTTQKLISNQFIYFLDQFPSIQTEKIALINAHHPIRSNEFLEKFSNAFYSIAGEFPYGKLAAKRIHLAGGALDLCLLGTLGQFMKEYFASQRSDPMSIFIHTQYTYEFDFLYHTKFSEWWSQRSKSELTQDPEALLEELLGTHAPLELNPRERNDLSVSSYKGPDGEGITFSFLKPKTTKIVHLTLLR